MYMYMDAKHGYRTSEAGYLSLVGLWCKLQDKDQPGEL